MTPDAAPTTPSRTVLERFRRKGPRGSWLTEQYAAARRAQGTDAQVVMDLRTDQLDGGSEGGTDLREGKHTAVLTLAFVSD